MVESIYGEGYQNFTPGKALVFAGNSYYGFKLKKENADDDWLIQTANQEYLEGETPRMAAEGTTHATCQRAWTLGPGIPLPNLLKAPGFQLLDVLPADNGPEGAELVEVSFDFHPKPGDKIPGVPMPPAHQARSLPRITGSLMFNPQSYWALVSYDIQSSLAEPGNKKRDVLHMECEILYANKPTPDGKEVPVPRKITERFNRPDGASVTQVTEITEWKFREIPEEEFTLSAYGLPEIPASPWGPKPVSRRNQLILLLAVNAVLFAIIAIWMALKYRRKKPDESPPAAAGPGKSS